MRIKLHQSKMLTALVGFLLFVPGYSEDINVRENSNFVLNAEKSSGTGNSNTVQVILNFPANTLFSSSDVSDLTEPIVINIPQNAQVQIKTGAAEEVPPCNDRWVHFAETSSCYQIIRNSTDFATMEGWCGPKGHITSITSIEEFNFVRSLVDNEFGAGQPAWIGLKTDMNCDLGWTDGTPETNVPGINSCFPTDPPFCAQLICGLSVPQPVSFYCAGGHITPSMCDQKYPAVCKQPQYGAVDECSVNNGGCSQMCVNLPESHECQCRPGYTLARDEKTCEEEPCDEYQFYYDGSDSCFYVPYDDSGEIKTVHSDASDLCLNSGGYLAVITNDATNALSDVSSPIVTFWIGSGNFSHCNSDWEDSSFDLEGDLCWGYGPAKTNCEFKSISCSESLFPLCEKPSKQRDPCRNSNGLCSHLCVNLPEGGYECQCPPGYTLGDNYRTCEGPCDENWTYNEETDSCYQIDNTKAGNYSEASDQCQQLGGYLAVASDELKTFYAGVKDDIEPIGHNGTVTNYWMSTGNFTACMPDWAGPDYGAGQDLCWNFEPLKTDTDCAFVSLLCQTRLNFICEKPNNKRNRCLVDNGNNCSHLCVIKAYNYYGCECPPGFTMGPDRVTCVNE